MTISNGILLIFCGLGVAQCLFLSGYMFALKEGSLLPNKIFSVLLIVLAVRLAKSLTYIFFDLDPVFMNVGYAAHGAIAPLLYLYILSRHSDEKLRPRYFLHLLPSIAILSLSTLLAETFWLTVGYSLLLYHMLIYLLLAWRTYIAQRKQNGLTDKLDDQWMLTLLAAISILWVAYFSNFILRLTSYITGPLLFSGMIYYLSFLAFRYHHKIVGFAAAPRKPLSISRQDLADLEKRLNASLIKSRMFLDPELTLQKLAINVGVPSYRLSQVINDHYRQSFSDLVNELRVNEAQRKLSDHHEDNKKIAAIAFESGFNTLSAFNNAFKKVTKTTPSEFRKRS